MLKGDARTKNLPRDLDDVGVVWESRSGYETAWATPGHVCSCSYSYGHRLIPPFFYRGGEPVEQGRIPSDKLVR